VKLGSRTSEVGLESIETKSDEETNQSQQRTKQKNESPKSNLAERKRRAIDVGRVKAESEGECEGKGLLI
jgi:hypothetical protein